MPLAPAVAAALTDASSHPWGLFVGGMDVIDLTRISSIEVVEAGPGGVSSMTFTVTDPDKVFTIADGAEVQYWDLANNVLQFRGFVDHWSPTPLVTGRVFSVSCVGVEAWLDWVVVPGGLSLPTPGIQAFWRDVGVLSNEYAPFLHAPTEAGQSNMVAPYTQAGSFDYPIGHLKRATEPAIARWYPAVAEPYVTTGGTLRQAIQSIADGARWKDSSTGEWSLEPISVMLTVDFYLNVRLWEDDPALQPDDYATLFLDDTLPSVVNVAEGLQFDHEPGDVFRAVYVKGVDAASSGLFGDGTGIAGPQGYVNDAAILSADQARARAVNFLATQGEQVRGSFSLSDFTPDPDVHAGSLVRVLDEPTGADTGARDGTAFYRIYEIRKTYNKSGRQNWTVGFGGLPRSASRLIRKLAFTGGQS